MNAVTQLWERQPKEPTQWYERFQLYLYLGPARSLIAVYRAEAKSKKSAEERGRARNVPGAWFAAVKRWDWYARAIAFDDAERKKRDALYAARADEILASGFAVRFTRIAELNRLAELLQEEIWTDDKRWLPDVKQIGSGEDAERVDLVRFNTSVIEQYRQTLEDIAVEMGERVRGVKVSGSLGIAQMSADDLAKAADEADTWEQQMSGQMDYAQSDAPTGQTDECFRKAETSVLQSKT